MGDYHTKFNPPSHHKKQIPLHVQTETSPQYIPCDTSTLHQGYVKQFTAVYIINMSWGERYSNKERLNISHGKVLATCVAILGAHPNTIRSINEILRMSVNRD